MGVKAIDGASTFMIARHTAAYQTSLQQDINDYLHLWRVHLPPSSFPTLKSPSIILAPI